VIEAPDLLEPVTRSGRVAWDERGRGIWEWQTKPGVYSRDVNIHELNMLANELRLVETPERRARNFEGLWIHDNG
jgi:hypothetical protein